MAPSGFFSRRPSMSGPLAAEDAVIVPKQSHVLLVMRVLILVAVVILASLLGFFSFYVLHRVDTRRFEADHSTISELIGVQVTRNLDTAITCLEDLAGTLDLPPGGRSLFFHFEKSAKLKSTLSGARSYSVLPLVPAIERQTFELWAAENADAIVAAYNVSVEARPAVTASLRTGIKELAPSFHPNGSFAGVAFVRAGEVLPGMPPVSRFLPALQTFPVDADAVMLDVLNASSLLKRLEADLLSSPGRIVATGLDLQPLDALGGAPLSPTIRVAAPVTWTDPATGLPVTTGAVAAVVEFQRLLRVDISSGPELVFVVSSAGNNVDPAAYGLRFDSSAYSFAARSGRVVPVGWGELKSSGIESYKRTVTLLVGKARFDVSVRQRLCSPTLQSADKTMVYPTSAWRDSYTTRIPADAVITAVLLTIGLACAFFALDLFSRKHLERLYRTEVVSTAAHAADREKMRNRHAFVSMVSHEIRTPASCIIGALDLILSTKVTDFQLDLLKMIQTGGGQILSLVEDALRMGEQGTGQFIIRPRRISPRKDILQKSWETIRLQKRFEDKIKSIIMELDIGSELPDTAVVDGDRVVQITTNLLQNSLKFVRAGSGRIKLSATYDGPSSILRIIVVDNGRGMAPDGIERIFQPWAQAEGADTKSKFGGTGLGLVISRDLAVSLGGDLTCSSAGIGCGCTFVATVYLASPEWGNRQPSAVDSHVSTTSAGTGSSPARSRAAPAVEGSVNDSGASGSVCAALPRRSQPRISASSPLSGLTPQEQEAAFSVAPSAAALVHSGARGLRAILSSPAEPHEELHGDIPLRRISSSTVPRTRYFTDTGEADGKKPPASFARRGGPRESLEAESFIPRALCAEDDDLCRRVLKMTLKLASIDCDAVSDGMAATMLLEADPAAYDIIILDGSMGGGERDGLPSLQRIRDFFTQHNLRAPPVVILSGESDAKEHERYIQAGAARVVVKPASQKDLRGLRALATAHRLTVAAGGGAGIRIMVPPPAPEMAAVGDVLVDVGSAPASA